jgi:hypothetical protein
VGSMAAVLETDSENESTVEGRLKREGLLRPLK